MSSSKSSKQKQTESTSVWKNLLAGGGAGAIEATINYPTEYIKTQLQLQSAAVKSGAVPKFSGVRDCFIKTIRSDGVFGLYRGLSTLLIGSMPKTAVRFAAFGQFKALLADRSTGKMTPTQNMLAGLGAGVAEAVIAVTPAETVKTKMIDDMNSKQPRYKGLVHGVGVMVREEGIRGVYRGVVPTALKQGCNQATRFTIYEALKGQLKAWNGTNDIPAWQITASGMTAGFISVYVTMPFDTIKTKMQSLEATKYTGSLDCALKILRNQGMLAFFKGTTPRLLRVTLSGGITFLAYEQLIKTILWIAPDK